MNRYTWTAAWAFWYLQGVPLHLCCIIYHLFYNIQYIVATTFCIVFLFFYLFLRHALTVRLRTFGFCACVFFMCDFNSGQTRHLGCYTQFCCAQHTAMMSWTWPFTYIPSHDSDSLWHVFPSGLRMNPSLHLHTHESPALTNSCSQPCFPSAQGSSSAGAIRREIKLLYLLGVITAVVAPLPPTVYLCAVTYDFCAAISLSRLNKYYLIVC